MLDILFGRVKGIFNAITLIEFVYSVLCVILGIIFFSNPQTSNYTLSLIVGCMFIIYSIMSIFFFIKRGDIELYKNNLIYAFLLLITGILAFFLKRNLVIVLGIYLIIVGIERINYSLVLKKYNEVSWLLTLVTGIIFIIIAIITFFGSDDTIVAITGVYLLGFGLFNFINILLLRRRSEYFLA